ncbi:alpha/beta-hydrolase [Clavulina sp. PMI_390]|nr:alpha/beta-hydrolase [Clavulina sp. PMI_390]
MSSPLTPAEMLELPRPGNLQVNPKGDLALITISEHSFDTKKTSRRIEIHSVNQFGGHPGSLNGSEAFWLDSRTVCHVVTDEESDEQQLFAVSLSLEEGGSIQCLAPRLIGTLPAAVSASNFKYANKLLVFSAYVYSDEDLATVKDQDERKKLEDTTAMTFDSLYVRHWDRYTGPKHSSIFAVHIHSDDGEGWHLDQQFFAPLRGTGHSTPVEPFGGAEDFDVYGDSLVYTTKDPAINDATHTRQNIYLTTIIQRSTPRMLTSGGQGATKAPIFDRSGDRVAWLELKEDGYESDASSVVLFDVRDDVRYTLKFGQTFEPSTVWDRSPEAITFTTDNKRLILTVGDHARVKIFLSSVLTTTKARNSTMGIISVDLVTTKPEALTHDGAASAVQATPDGSIIFLSSSLNGPNNIYILKPQGAGAYTTSRVSDFGDALLKTKKLESFEEINFEGANSVTIQGWVVRPYGWEPGHVSKWPAVLLIHGGAWEDQWSTRWNPQVFAQNGYFVIAINPTGKLQAFPHPQSRDWGGKPIVDLQKGFDFALQHFPEIDPQRTAAAGASYGGFAVNWIAGNSEKYGFNFKALVTHDGVFNTSAMGYSTEELFFWMHEFDGSPFDETAIATAEKWNPANYVKNFKIPHLIIHGSKDYRLTDGEGISMFTALQLKSVPSRLVLFPDENHWVLKPENSLKWHEEVFGWLDKHIA